MAVNRQKKADEQVKNTVKVEKLHQFKDGNIQITLNVNGVTIYGVNYREFTDKQTGEPKSFYAMPQRKGNDGKYYNIVYVKLTDEDNAEIDKQVEALL